MEIKQETVGKTGRFYIEDQNETVAEMDYELPEENILLITHTEVNNKLSGKGVGKQLVSAAVDYTRANSYNIKATCTFAKKVLDNTPEFSDVYHVKNKS